MFSLQVKTIFRVLGQALLTLANMPADGIERIDPADLPDVGADIGSNMVDQISDAAATFGAPPAPPAPPAAVTPPPPPAAAPIYVMKNPEFTREEWHGMGWNDEQLIGAGHMVLATPTPPAPLLTGEQPRLLDKDGVPWDERIHSGGRTQTKDNLWTKKKGVDAAYHAQITAELKGASPAVPFVPLTAAAPPPPVSAPPAPPAPPAAEGISFMALCKLISSSAIPLPKVNAAVQAVGLKGITDLNTPANQHLIAQVYNVLAA